MAFVYMDPNVAGKISRRLAELRPELPTIDVSFVCARGAERYTQTDDEAQDGKKYIRHNKFVHEF